jgi:hypothetical protein
MSIFQSFYLPSTDPPPFFKTLFDGVVSTITTFWQSISSSETFMTFQIILFAISIFFFIGIVHVVIKIGEVNGKIYEKKKEVEKTRFFEKKPKRFDVVEKHMASDNPAEWRLAVVEADTILEEMVKKIGYPGKTLGEMLKNIETADFRTINDAWEAHKIRNQIAHQGSSFTLTEREAKRVVRLYKNVFEEFNLI